MIVDGAFSPSVLVPLCLRTHGPCQQKVPTEIAWAYHDVTIVDEVYSC